MKKILITGAAGFIGTSATHFYNNKGFDIIGVSSASMEFVKDIPFKKYFSIILPHPKLGELLKMYNPDILIHSVGSAIVGDSIKDSTKDFYSKVVVTREVLESVRINSPDTKVVFLSSAAVYGNPISIPVKEIDKLAPISPYGYTKLQCESLCEQFSKLYHLKIAVLRIFSVYGPGLSKQLFWDIFQKSLTGKTIKLFGTGKESRDFIFIDDLMDVILTVVNNSDSEFCIFNVASGQEVTIQKAANVFTKVINKGHNIEFNNMIKDGDPINWRADISRLKKIGFEPGNFLEQGLIKYYKWLQEKKLA